MAKKIRNKKLDEKINHMIFKLRFEIEELGEEWYVIDLCKEDTKESKESLETEGWKTRIAAMKYIQKEINKIKTHADIIVEGLN